MLKEENNKLKLDISEKKMSINSLTRKLNKERDKEMWQTESKKKYKDIHLNKIYHQKQETDLLHFKKIKMKCQIRKMKYQNTVNKYQYITSMIIDLTLSKIIYQKTITPFDNKKSVRKQYIQ